MTQLLSCTGLRAATKLRLGQKVQNHSLVLLFLIALAANLDNFGVGTAYGLAQRLISPISNFVVALMAVGLTYAAMVIGAALSTIIPASVANALGAGVIVLIGIWLIWEVPLQRIGSQVSRWMWHQFSRRWGSRNRSISKRDALPQRRESAADLNRSLSRIGVSETLILGVSLALNAMAGGVGASLSGYDPVLLSLATGIFSYGTIEAGQRLAGSYLSKRFGILAQPLAGIVLIGIGIYEFFV